MNADKLWHTYNSFRKRKVNQYKPAIYKALQAQIKHYTETRNVNNLPTQQLQETLKALYVDVGRIWATNSYYNVLKEAGIKKAFQPKFRIKRNGAIGLNEEFIQAIIDFFNVDLFNNVQRITDTTRNQIRTIVEQGIQQQLSLDEIINNLLTSGITKTRAEAISRTEIMKAASAAEQIGSDRTGLQTKKIWLSVRDNRTRRHHAEVDNQVRLDGKPFDVDGYEMQRPGDQKSADGRRVPGSLIINCRCTVGRQVLRDRNGLPLRKAILQT